MRLVVFSSHYPYGNGEVFLEDEIKVAEKEFDEIQIITYAKENEKQTRYVPLNARVVSLRKDSTRFENVWFLIKALFSFKAWQEIVSGCKERGWKRLKDVIKQVLVTERHIAFIKKSEPLWASEIGNIDESLFYSYWINPAAVYLARNRERLNTLCISRAHGGDCFFDREYVPWRKLVLSKLDGVFPISEKGVQDLEEHYKAYIKGLDKKLHLARLGVDIPETTDRPVKSQDKQIIVTCSNVIPLKRLDLLIEALTICRTENIHWVHFGDGPLIDQIQEMADKLLSPKENITYEFRGWTSKAEILEYYRTQKPKLFVNCSDVEGIPVSAMEAMAYGIPAVARDVGGNSELIDDSCGKLMPTKISCQELATCIDAMLGKEVDEFGKLSKGARQRITDKYDCNRNYHGFFEQIKGMMKENASDTKRENTR